MTSIGKATAIAACAALCLAVLTPFEAQAQGRGGHGRHGGGWHGGGWQGGAWRGGGWQGGARHAGGWHGQRWHGHRGHGGWHGQRWLGRHWNRGWAGPAAAGVIGGLALGALAGSAYGYGPAYAYPGGCYLQNRAAYDAWGQFIGYQRVRVCY